MNKTLKYTTALGASMFALAFAVTAASADTSVVNTGDGADINSGSNTTTSVRVVNNNEANVEQSSYSFVNTGGNDADRNIGGGSIATGDAVVVNEFEVQANANHTAVSGLGSTATSGDASIVNTGDNLEYNGGNRTETEVVVRNNNEANISQGSFSLVNTGENDADRNIRGGNIHTGNAGVSNEFSVQANANHTELDLSGMGNGTTGDLDFVNTGDNADINVGDNYRTNVRVVNNNELHAEQMSFNLVNTGGNDADRNVRGGSIMTGDALVANSFEVMANGNSTEIDLGDFHMGSNDDVEVVNTGDNLEVNSGNSVRTSVVVRSNNYAEVEQAAFAFVNTGDNDADRNIRGGNINSGDAGVWNCFLVESNWNWTEIN